MGTPARQTGSCGAGGHTWPPVRAGRAVVTFAPVPDLNQVRPFTDVYLYGQAFIFQKYFWTRPFKTPRMMLEMVFLIKIQALRLYFPCTSLVYNLHINVYRPVAVADDF